MIGFDGCTQNDADAFTSNFATGWEISTIESAGLKIFSASNGDEFMQFSWDPGEGQGNITYGENN